MAELDLSRYSTAALFNTKAVVQATGVTAATLRAWERRYGVPEPDRTDSNYRLYSERDIALIRWLRERVEGGISISQAVELYRRAQDGHAMPSHIPGDSVSPDTRGLVNDMVSAQARLIAAFKAFDEGAADRVLNELFAIYPVEEVLLSVMQPALIEIGEQWHRGEVSVPTEHFASSYVERKLMGLFNAQPLNAEGPLVIAGCAPHELHELGILLFAFFLRRLGARVLYLGANVPLMDIRTMLESLRPAMLALSAMSAESAEELRKIGRLIEEMPAPRPQFAFGGGIFRAHPALAEEIQGLHLGTEAREAARAALRYLRAGSG